MKKISILGFIFLIYMGLSANAQNFKILEPIKQQADFSNVEDQKKYKQAVNHIKEKEFETAIKKFNSIQGDAGESIAVQINSGIAAYLMGSMEQAKKHFDNVLSENEAVHWAWFGNGLVALSSHHSKDAANNFAIAHQLRKGNGKYQLMHGIALKEDAQFKKALQVLKSCSQNDQYKAEAYLEMGNIYAQKLEYDKSIEYYNKAEENGASTDKIALNKAKVSSVNKEKSIDKLDEYIDLHKDDPDGYIMRANALLAKNNFDKAIDDYSKAIKINENKVNAYNGRAAAYLRKADFKSALDDCNQAINLDPNFALPYFNRGIAKEMLRDLEGACADWQQAFFMGISKAEEYLNSPTCNNEN